MPMTKKQEKAIKNIETLSEYGLCYAITNEVKEDMKIILDMIKKQEQKLNDLKNNTIPRTKVEETIQQLNDEFETLNTGNDDNWYILSEQYAFAEDKLRELLEEK